MAGYWRNAGSSNAKKRQGIPDRWNEYVSCGKPIVGERLIAFKTPLAKEYYKTGVLEDINGFEINEEFTPHDLLKKMRENDSVIGLVLDFTNTNRYYNPDVLEHNGVKYIKIKCEGRIVPPEHVVKRCKVAILSYLKRFPTCNSLVGVHCTHGLNRTGYIVCRYLIDCKGYTPEKAINVFNKARGHDIERAHYIKDLMQRTPKKISNRDIDNLISIAPPNDVQCRLKTDTRGYSGNADIGDKHYRRPEESDRQRPEESDRQRPRPSHSYSRNGGFVPEIERRRRYNGRVRELDGVDGNWRHR